MLSNQINLDVDARETTDDLLARLAGIPPDTSIRLYVPPGAVALRGLSDVDRLRTVMVREGRRVTVTSSDAAFLMRARIYGLQTETVSEPPSATVSTPEPAPGSVPTPA